MALHVDWSDVREGEFLMVCENVKVGEDDVAAHYEDSRLLQGLRDAELIGLKVSKCKLREVLVHDSL